MDLTAFQCPYALNVRTNISSYGPRARLIRAYSAVCSVGDVLKSKFSPPEGCSEEPFPILLGMPNLRYGGPFGSDFYSTFTHFSDNLAVFTKC